MARKGGKYVVTAQVCDTIRSVPVEKKQASKMAKETRKRVPKARVKVSRA